MPVKLAATNNSEGAQDSMLQGLTGDQIILWQEWKAQLMKQGPNVVDMWANQLESLDSKERGSIIELQMRGGGVNKLKSSVTYYTFVESIFGSQAMNFARKDGKKGQSIATMLLRESTTEGVVTLVSRLRDSSQWRAMHTEYSNDEKNELLYLLTVPNADQVLDSSESATTLMNLIYKNPDMTKQWLEAVAVNAPAKSEEVPAPLLNAVRLAMYIDMMVSDNSSLSDPGAGVRQLVTDAAKKLLDGSIIAGPGVPNNIRWLAMSAATLQLYLDGEVPRMCGSISALLAVLLTIILPNCQVEEINCVSNEQSCLTPDARLYGCYYTHCVVSVTFEGKTYEVDPMARMIGLPYIITDHQACDGVSARGQFSSENAVEKITPCYYAAVHLIGCFPSLAKQFSDQGSGKHERLKIKIQELMDRITGLVTNAQKNPLAHQSSLRLLNMNQPVLFQVDLNLYLAKVVCQVFENNLFQYQLLAKEDGVDTLKVVGSENICSAGQRVRINGLTNPKCQIYNNEIAIVQDFTRSAEEVPRIGVRVRVGVAEKTINVQPSNLFMAMNDPEDAQSEGAGAGGYNNRISRPQEY